MIALLAFLGHAEGDEQVIGIWGIYLHMDRMPNANTTQTHVSATTVWKDE